jgi:hypothetical protein
VLVCLGLSSLEEKVNLCRAIQQTMGEQSCRSCQYFANYFSYQKSLQEQGLSHQTHMQQTISTILHAINVVFSNDFIVDFLAINNCKSQVDHKMGTTHKDFYIHACNAHNACDEGFLDLSEDENGNNSSYMLLVYPPGDKYLADLEKQDGINLHSVNQFTGETFWKKIMDSFTICKLIKTNMGISRHHNGNAWDFIQHAVTVTHVKGVTHDINHPIAIVRPGVVKHFFCLFKFMGCSCSSHCLFIGTQFIVTVLKSSKSMPEDMFIDAKMMQLSNAYNKEHDML